MLRLLDTLKSHFRRPTWTAANSCRQRNISQLLPCIPPDPPVPSNSCDHQAPPLVWRVPRRTVRGRGVRPSQART